MSESQTSKIPDRLMRQVRIAEQIVPIHEYARERLSVDQRKSLVWNSGGWCDPVTGIEGGTFELWWYHVIGMGVEPDANAARKFILSFAPEQYQSALEGISVKNLLQIQDDYIEFTKKSKSVCFNLKTFLPMLQISRPLVPGELCAIIAETGVGKTAFVQNLAVATGPLACLVCELELPSTLMFERFLQIGENITDEQVVTTFESGKVPPWFERGNLNHIYVCDRLLSCEDIEKQIVNMELLHGVKPAVLIVDYVGLVLGKGKDRYERVSNTAEGLKQLVKRQNVIGIMISQIARSSTGEPPHLHSGKDSGAIEDSSGLVLALWRDAENNKIINLAIRKNTKGSSGQVVQCDFDVRTMRISQRSNVPSDDKQGKLYETKKKGGMYGD